MNQVRYITLRYEDSIKGFSEDAILSATFGRTVVDRKEYFFVQDGVPHLLVSLLLSGQGTGDVVPPRRTRGGEGNPEERLAGLVKSVEGSLAWYGFKGILRPVERIVSERIRKAGEEEAGGNADNRPLRGGSFNDDFTMKARRR